jgi:lipopolysaccharide transport system ATP-binding protein
VNSGNAIEICTVGKMYRIARQAQHATWRRRLITAAVSPFDWLVQQFRMPSDDETFWALRNITFSIPRGQVCGIIGRNGAGKSTLLKILSRITEPSEGSIRIHGRVASLLEVGTGMHPELTGRENVFLNGAILGMKRSEIARKYDEIVDFSGVERFIDTPVKRYSSGMRVRLGFSVAAHLEPEILLVDEVLAVGDAGFQKKCLGKIDDIAHAGRTILFVSHNMPAIQSLCDHAVLLEDGQLVAKGDVSSVVARYLESSLSRSSTPIHDRSDRHGSGVVRLKGVQIVTAGGRDTVCSGDRLSLTLSYCAAGPVRSTVFRVRLSDHLGRTITMLDSEVAGGLPEVLPPNGVVVCTTAPLNVSATQCIVNVAVLVGGTMADHVKQALTFEIGESDFFGTGRMPPVEEGMYLVAQTWTARAARPGDSGPACENEVAE